MHSMSSVLLQQSRQDEVEPEKVLARLCSCCQSSDEVAFSDRSRASEESSSAPLRPCVLFCRMRTSGFRAGGALSSTACEHRSDDLHRTCRQRSLAVLSLKKGVGGTSKYTRAGRLPLSDAPIAMVLKARTPDCKGDAQGLARLHHMPQGPRIAEVYGQLQAHLSQAQGQALDESFTHQSHSQSLRDAKA